MALFGARAIVPQALTQRKTNMTWNLDSQTLHP